MILRVFFFSSRTDTFSLRVFEVTTEHAITKPRIVIWEESNFNRKAYIVESNPQSGKIFVVFVNAMLQNCFHLAKKLKLWYGLNFKSENLMISVLGLTSLSRLVIWLMSCQVFSYTKHHKMRSELQTNLCNISDVSKREMNIILSSFWRTSPHYFTCSSIRIHQVCEEWSSTCHYWQLLRNRTDDEQ